MRRSRCGRSTGAWERGGAPLKIHRKRAGGQTGGPGVRRAALSCGVRRCRAACSVVVRRAALRAACGVRRIVRRGRVRRAAWKVVSGGSVRERRLGGHVRGSGASPTNTGSAFPRRPQPPHDARPRRMPHSARKSAVRRTPHGRETYAGLLLPDRSHVFSGFFFAAGNSTLFRISRYPGLLLCSDRSVGGLPIACCGSSGSCPPR
jgi:hypothetical protein